MICGEAISIVAIFDHSCGEDDMLVVSCKSTESGKCSEQRFELNET